MDIIIFKWPISTLDQCVNLVIFLIFINLYFSILQDIILLDLYWWVIHSPTFHLFILIGLVLALTSPRCLVNLIAIALDFHFRKLLILIYIFILTKRRVWISYHLYLLLFILINWFSEINLFFISAYNLLIVFSIRIQFRYCPLLLWHYKSWSRKLWLTIHFFWVTQTIYAFLMIFIFY